MMEGITVLNVIENPIYGFVWNGGVIFFLVFIAVVLIIGIGSSVMITEDWPFLLALLFIIPALWAISVSGNKQIDSYPTYEVTIANEVSMIEFIEKYEIIEQRGEIYEIKERETQKEADSN